MNLFIQAKKMLVVTMVWRAVSTFTLECFWALINKEFVLSSLFGRVYRRYDEMAFYQCMVPYSSCASLLLYRTSLPPSTIPLSFLGLYYDLFKQIMIRHRQPPYMYGTHVGELQDSWPRVCSWKISETVSKMGSWFLNRNSGRWLAALAECQVGEWV